MTLPRDRTLGPGESVPYGVPEQPGAYMSGPTDVSIRSNLFAEHIPSVLSGYPRIGSS